MKYALAALLPFVFMGCADFTKPLPVVFLVGDSITHGYAPTLQQKLNDKAIVDIEADNARNAAYTATHVQQWLTDSRVKLGAPTAIVWNNGMWNAAKPDVYGTRYQTDAEYVECLKKIATVLLGTGAKVYFTLTTKIPAEADLTSFNIGYEVHLNQLAQSTLAEFPAITIIDLYSVSLTAPNIVTGDVHYGAEGNEILATEVYRWLSLVLPAAP